MDDLRDTLDTYEAVADRYRDRHADRSVVADQVEQFLSALADAGHERDARILDAGCGPGWETATFRERGHRPLGVDLSSSFLAIAREEAPDAALARMDVRRLGVRGGSIDGVWACASLVHLPREAVPGVLAEFARVLGSPGVVHLSLKRGEGGFTASAYEGDRREFTLFSPAEVRGMLPEAGFSVAAFEAGPDWIVATATRSSVDPGDTG